MNKCLQCEKEITGRSDKKFCDAYCRNSYNNRVKRREEEQILRINSIIRRNRRILKTLCPQGKASVRKEVFDQLGYDYHHFSGIYRAPKGQVYFMCYDYGFSATQERGVEKALIIQEQPYFKNYVPNPWKLIRNTA